MATPAAPAATPPAGGRTPRSTSPKSAAQPEGRRSSQAAAAGRPPRPQAPGGQQVASALVGALVGRTAPRAAQRCGCSARRCGLQ
eukprot:scaffold48134_cov63-Phaeocystis_antarctica.AAC.5